MRYYIHDRNCSERSASWRCRLRSDLVCVRWAMMPLTDVWHLGWLTSRFWVKEASVWIQSASSTAYVRTIRPGFLFWCVFSVTVTALNVLVNTGKSLMNVIFWRLQIKGFYIIFKCLIINVFLYTLKKKKSIISDWSLCWIKCYWGANDAFISNKWCKQLLALHNETQDTAAHYSMIIIA